MKILKVYHFKVFTDRPGGPNYQIKTIPYHIAAYTLEGAQRRARNYLKRILSPGDQVRFSVDMVTGENNHVIV